MTTWYIVGGGRIGGALAARARDQGQRAVVLGRHDDWSVLDAPAGPPILVCTRNDDLDAVLARVPVQRHADLVFVQNGMIRPWLATHGLSNATRGLLFFAVQTRGAPMDLGPPSPFHGPHAAQIVAQLLAIGVPAEVVTPADFAALELEKLLWNCIFGLLCQAYQQTVGEVLDAHLDEVTALHHELLAVGQAALGLTLDAEAVLARLVAYSRAILSNRAAVREWPWRSGWFVAEATRQGRALPVHARLCVLAGVP